jgi:hypothetical protein
MAAGTIYKGRNVRIRIGDKILYHSTSATINITSNTTEVATKDTNGTIVTPDNYTWSASLESLWANKETGQEAVQLDPKDLIGHQLANDLLTFEFSTDVTGDDMYTGSCYVTNTDLGAEVGNSATASFQFTGSGDLTAGTVPV